MSNINKTAIITGILGQDGLLLAKFLIDKGYHIIGVEKSISQNVNLNYFNDLQNIANSKGLEFQIRNIDISDEKDINILIAEIKPSEIYNFAAQSNSVVSYEKPIFTSEVNANAVLYLLEAVKNHCQKCKIFQAASSELFGVPKEVPQTENTSFDPVSPYAIAKLYSFYMCRTYRQKYNIFVCNGILYNHESPLRGENFVTRKITLALARIKAGLQDCLYLGNYDSERDWSYAGDFVEAMWLMLQQKSPDDYVLSSGTNHTVRKFVEIASDIAGFKLEWRGKGVNEVGVDKSTGKTIVAVNEEFYRPKEANKILGNSEKTVKLLGWKRKVSFNKLVDMMMNEDIANFN